MAKKGLPTDFESFLTWDALTAILSYDPATGEFRWIKTDRLGWKNRLAGTIDQGYRKIEIAGRAFFASRLAYLYMTKRWPRGLIDHTNGNRGDDRWTNLRQVSRLENRRNWAPYLATSDGYEVPKNPVREKTWSRPTVAVQKRGITSDFESFLTQDIVVKYLSYDPASGIFTWRDNSLNPKRIKVGQQAGCTIPGKYTNIVIMGRNFRAHRVAWLYMTGHWPKGDVDHKNGEKSDNSWTNLRDATRSQNTFNQRRKKANASGMRGITAHGNGWRARVGHNNKEITLGTFSTKEEARDARLAYEREHFGEFAVLKVEGE